MSGEIVLGHALWQIMFHGSTFVPVHVGVYGASETGKTTLDMQLTTKGEIRPLGEQDRTHHKKSWLGRERMPESTRKRVKSDGIKSRTIISRDVGGHTEYHSMWLRDMIERNVKTVVVVVDHRHLKDNRNTDNQVALGYLVEALSNKTVPKGLSIRARLRAKRYTPNRIILLANKADEWMVEEQDFDMFETGMIANHPIFDAFREHLFALQEMAIPVHVDAISATRNFNVQHALMKGMGFQ